MSSSVSPEVLRSLLLAFEAAARSLEACRLLLSQCVAENAELLSFEEDGYIDDTCHHSDAIQIVTMGDGDNTPIYLCPDCGEQFE